MSKIPSDHGLTSKQKAFADEIIKNPHISNTQAAINTLDVTTENSAAVSAYKMMQTEKVQAYLAKHSQKAEDTILEVMEYSRVYGKTGGKEGAAYAAVAVTVAKDVLDRLHGKATQKIETQNTSVNVNIDLSGASDPKENH
jgi:phage terminase small subunit